MSIPPTPSSNRRVGIIGLGLVGLGLAGRYLSAGFHVSGHDVSESQTEALRKLGGTPASHVSAVVDANGAVLLSLPADPEVLDVFSATAGHWRPGKLLINTTTGSPEVAEALDRKLRECGAHFIDATLSGSSEQIGRGDATVFIGAQPEDLATFEAIVQVLGRERLHLGPPGAGARAKLVTNLVLGLNRAALAEGLVFAQSIGLDPQSAARALQTGASYSRIMDTKMARMLERRFEPVARLHQHLKDVLLILEASRKAEVRLPLTEAHRSLLEIGVHLGLGDLDNSAILAVLESISIPRPNENRSR